MPYGPTCPSRKILNTDSRFGNSKKTERNEKIERALDMVRMEDFRDRAVNTLSGGQQQRIALARALVIEPSVLLLDEPISNLDAALRQQMRDEIKQIHDRTNITMFYVTHDQVDALSMADRMAIMQDGVIIQVGTPARSLPVPEEHFRCELRRGNEFHFRHRRAGIKRECDYRNARRYTPLYKRLSRTHTRETCAVFHSTRGTRY